MRSLRKSISEYLELRRSLGFRLKQAEWQLENFARFMRRRRAVHITTKLALQWAQQPASTDGNYLAARLGTVRSFARYRILSDSKTEIPASDLLPRRRIVSRPHLYTDEEIGRVLAGSLTLCDGSPFTCLGHHMVYGLLSVTGMRVSEALNLDLEDVDLDQGIINIRKTKFGKSRLVPVHETTCTALKLYRGQRDAFLDGKVAKPFFISRTGRRIDPSVLDRSFRELTRQLGMCSATDKPRLHDLRHTMAVEVLRRCYRSGANPERRLPALSTYLGHTNLNYTYWYLHQNPSLMTEAMRRLRHRWEALA